MSELELDLNAVSVVTLGRARKQLFEYWYGTVLFGLETAKFQCLFLLVVF